MYFRSADQSSTNGQPVQCEAALVYLAEVRVQKSRSRQFALLAEFAWVASICCSLLDASCSAMHFFCTQYGAKSPQLCRCPCHLICMCKSCVSIRLCDRICAVCSCSKCAAFVCLPAQIQPGSQAVGRMVCNPSASSLVHYDIPFLVSPVHHLPKCDQAHDTDELQAPLWATRLGCCFCLLTGHGVLFKSIQR